MAIQFFANPWSRAAIARWMLEELEVDYDLRYVSFKNQECYNELAKYNPMKKVPTIVHNDNVVTETAAICAYLADAFSEKQLAPQLAERAEYYRWLFFAAGPLEAAITNKSMGWTSPEDKSMMLGYGSYERTVETLASALENKDYIAAGRFTAADVYVGSQIIWGLEFKTLPAHKAFQAYASNLKARPAYVRAHEKDQALAQEQNQ